MKTRNTRILAVLMAATMTFSLAGCGDTSGEVNNEGSTDTKVQESSAASEVESAADDGVVEMTTLKVLTSDRSSTDNSGNTVSLSDWVAGKGGKLYDQLVADLASYGVEIEWDIIPADQWNTVLQTKIVAGLDKYDLVYSRFLDGKTKQNLIDNGTLVAVNEIWENYSDGTAKEFCTTGVGGQIYTLNRNVDGNNYGICATSAGLYEGQPMGGIEGLIIRQDWLDKLELEMPTTSEQLFDVLVAFREQDANGNGKKDEIVSVRLDDFANGFAQMFGLINTAMDLDTVKENKITSAFYQEGVKDYFAYMNRLYEAGILDVSGQANAAENNIGVLCNYWQVSTLEPQIVVPEGAAAPQYVGLACTTEYTDKPIIRRSYGISGYENLAVTSSADKAAVGRLLDYFSTQEYTTLTEWGIEGYSFDVVDGVNVGRPNSDISEVQIVSKGTCPWWSALVRCGGTSDFGAVVESIDEPGKTLGYPETGFAEKEAAVRNVLEHQDEFYFLYTDAGASLLAAATPEESELNSELYTDLQTYYSELCLKLIMGELSLDNWDTYIAEMQELGLDEMLDMFQARYDRAQ